MNGKTLVFYYHYNQSIGSDGDVILKSKDWPYTEAEWLAGAGASNPTCAVYQLYDSNGVKLDYQLRTYYYSPNADKLNNSLSIANYWQIEEVRIMPLDGKPAKKQKFDYTAPDNFSQVSGTTADDPNSFAIPWESAWNKSKTGRQGQGASFRAGACGEVHQQQDWNGARYCQHHRQEVQWHLFARLEGLRDYHGR